MALPRPLTGKRRTRQPMSAEEVAAFPGAKRIKGTKRYRLEDEESRETISAVFGRCSTDSPWLRDLRAWPSIASASELPTGARLIGLRAPSRSSPSSASSICATRQSAHAVQPVASGKNAAPH
jgi:hypothetical protein